MQRFLHELFQKFQKWTFIFVLFRKFLKSFVKNVTFVTDSSQNLFDSKQLCDHKKNFWIFQFSKKRFREFLCKYISENDLRKSGKKWQKVALYFM